MLSTRKVALLRAAIPNAFHKRVLKQFVYNRISKRRRGGTH